jgi:quinol monooxygenase YgiN
MGHFTAHNPTQPEKTSSMIQVIVVIQAKPGHRQALLDAFKANIPAVHAENGCIEYSAFVDIEGFGPPQTPYGSDTFIVIEKWNTAADLKAHARAPHMTAYQASVKEFIENRTVHLLSHA